MMFEFTLSAPIEISLTFWNLYFIYFYALSFHIFTQSSKYGCNNRSTKLHFYVLSILFKLTIIDVIDTSTNLRKQRRKNGSGLTKANALRVRFANT